MDSFRQEDAVSIERCRKGSNTAFEVIVRKYMIDAYFIALGLVGNREDALDLSQEAFIRAYNNIEKFNSERRFFPWFYQILRNLCFSHLRKRKREQGRFVTGLDSEQTNIEAAAADDFAPDIVAERSESKDRVWKAISKLEPKHREVIILRHFQNLSYEEISKVLLCNKGTVTSRLYYARKRLKEILES